MCMKAGPPEPIGMSTTEHPSTGSYTFGALPQGDGTVLFTLWAPALDAVQLEIAGQPGQAMERNAEGLFRLRCLCQPGARYRYRGGDGLCFPDPASRLQNGDVHDASVVVDTESYDWRNEDWRGRPWTEVVLYEMHCGLAGGFRGVQEQLARLSELGVTALELMPLADFPGPRNWGYDGVLPYAPDGAYGTPADLKLLIDTAHGMGMMVFLDVVYNHFGPEGNYLPRYAPAFYRNDLESP